MSNWIRTQKPFDLDDHLGPLQLAWLGDSVWELHQRLLCCRKSARSADLHRAVVGKVNASAQAKVLLYLEPHLTDLEIDLVRRGRNSAARRPRQGDASIYGKATGFETMVGWLFLKNPARLAQLFDHLEEIELDSL